MEWQSNQQAARFNWFVRMWKLHVFIDKYYLIQYNNPTILLVFISFLWPMQASIWELCKVIKIGYFRAISISVANAFQSVTQCFFLDKFASYISKRIKKVFAMGNMKIIKWKWNKIIEILFQSQSLKMRITFVAVVRDEKAHEQVIFRCWMNIKMNKSVWRHTQRDENKKKRNDRIK